MLSHSSIGQFTEDGSFIGQYVPGKLQPPVSPPTPHNFPTNLATVTKQSQPAINSANASSSAAVATYV